MYIRNMRGPNTDPWGTPSETGSKLDQEFLLKSTCDVNLLSKLSIIFKEWRVMNNVDRGRVIVLFVLYILYTDFFLLQD